MLNIKQGDCFIFKETESMYKVVKKYKDNTMDIKLVHRKYPNNSRYKEGHIFEGYEFHPSEINIIPLLKARLLE